MSVYYSQKSQEAFDTLHPDLQKIFLYIKDVLQIDHSILCGERKEKEQNALYYATPPRTHVKFPDSFHNTSPSCAVDAVPYVRLPNRMGGIHWHDQNETIQESYYREMVRFSSIVQMVALLKFNIKLTWGGDWNKDWSLMDNKFNDYPHYQLAEKV